MLHMNPHIQGSEIPHTTVNIGIHYCNYIKQRLGSTFDSFQDVIFSLLLPTPNSHYPSSPLKRCRFRVGVPVPVPVPYAFFPRLMADNVDESPKFDGDSTVMEKVAETFHDHLDSSSSSDDDFDAVPEAKKSPPTMKMMTPPSDTNKPKVYRLFGRDRPVHHVLGGGMPADVLLWRNKKLSAGALGIATSIWVLFELMEYHLLTLVCHGLIASLAILFLWSNGTTFINKKPPHFPEVSITEQPVLEFISILRFEINRSLALLREIASGRDLKKFILVISGLWVMSKVGSWCNLVTLVYLVFVILHTVPVLYEKHEDKVDPLAEKAMIEMKKHYAVMDAKVLSKIPIGPLKEKKI